MTKGIGHTKFKQTDIGPIPESWQLMKIDELVKDKDGVKTGPFGSSLKKEIFVSEGFKIYGQENVIPDDFTIGDYYIPEKVFLKMQSYEIRPGDILISLVGTRGKISLVPQNIKRGIINPRLLRIRTDPSRVSPRFMKFLLESSLIQKQIQQYTHGLTMGIINTAVVRMLSFFIPPINEQDRIIEIMNSIDSLLQQNIDYRKYSEYLRNGLMRKLLTGKIRVKV